MKRKIKCLLFLVCMLFFLGNIKTEAETVSQNISVNTSYSGQLASSGDVRQYRFQLSNAGKVNVTFHHANISSTNNYWKIEVYNESKECLMRMYSAGTETGKTGMDVGLEAGNYYLQVSQEYYSSVGYNFTLNYTASDYWESEANDGYGTADNISVNTRYSGANQFYGDKDYYKFVLNGAGKVSLNFQHPILNDTRTYWKVHIYNEQTEHLLELDVKGTDANVNSAELGLETGIYYVLVDTDYFDSATYTFEVNYTASDYWEKEANDGYGTADNIVLNTDYSGANQFYDDNDYYKFVLNSAGKVSVHFRHPILNDNKTYWKLYIYNEQTDTLLNMSVKGTEYDITSAELGLSAGSYYFFVDADYHSSKTYTFQISYTASDFWETELNDGYATADEIVMGTGYYGASQRNGDNDYYKFQMNSAGDIRINFKHENLNDNKCYWKIYLYNDSVQELAVMESKGAESSVSSDNISLQAGTYYIHVRPDYYSTATYTLSVSSGYSTSKPTLKASALAYNQIKLSWNKYSSASGYGIYRSTSKNGTYKEIKAITNKSTTSYIDTKVTPGKTYYYRVRPYKNVSGKKTYGSYSSIVKVKAAPAKVTISSVKAGAKRASVTWKKQKNISGYEVYMSTNKDRGYKKVKTISKASTTRYVKTGLTKGKKYYFKVRAYKAVNGKKIYGDFSSAKGIKITR